MNSNKNACCHANTPTWKKKKTFVFIHTPAQTWTTSETIFLWVSRQVKQQKPTPPRMTQTAICYCRAYCTEMGGGRGGGWWLGEVGGKRRGAAQVLHLEHNEERRSEHEWGRRAKQKGGQRDSDRRDGNRMEEENMRTGGFKKREKKQVKKKDWGTFYTWWKNKKRCCALWICCSLHAWLGCQIGKNLQRWYSYIRKQTMFTWT